MHSSPNKKNYLFISHDASRSGAPMVLLHFLNWLKKNTNHKITVITLFGGDLEEAFSKVGKVYIWQTHRKNLIQRIQQKVFGKNTYTRQQKRILKEVKTLRPDLVYTNTVVSNGILPHLDPVINCSVVCHVHENEFSLKAYYAEFLQETYLQYISRFIAVSKSTETSLTNVFHIPSEKVLSTYEFIPLEEFQRPTRSKEEIKNELELSSGDFIVGGAGTFLWRKGIDLFLLLAYAVKKMMPATTIKFMWVGGGNDAVFEHQVAYEQQRMGLENMVYFTGMKSIPQNYFQVFDLFVLTSREDPFPLVCIESASLGKPIVCFEQSGGIPEMVENGGGYALPYGDLDALARKIIQLQQDQHLYAEKAKEIEAIAKQYDVHRIAPQIEKFINSI